MAKQSASRDAGISGRHLVAPAQGGGSRWSAQAAAPRRGEDDGLDSLFDVPAAVLCAFCGQADCSGCVPEEALASGVVAIVPWERSEGGTWKRLWATTTATTQGAEAFFSALPDGSVSPAVRFAVLAEVLAVSGFAAALVPIAAGCLALMFPGAALDLLLDPAMRLAALRWVLVLVPGFSLCVVAAHASHGVALDLGATREGARSQRRRALRAGLYACGWDLMASPLGALMTLLTRGVAAALGALGEGLNMSVPRRASMALLQGVYGLRAEAAVRARRVGSLAAALLIAVSAAAVLALVSLLILLG
jgi:hypothetical protein